MAVVSGGKKKAKSAGGARDEVDSHADILFSDACRQGPLG